MRCLWFNPHVGLETLWHPSCTDLHFLSRRQVEINQTWMRSIPTSVFPSPMNANAERELHVWPNPLGGSSFWCWDSPLRPGHLYYYYARQLDPRSSKVWEPDWKTRGLVNRLKRSQMFDLVLSPWWQSCSLVCPPQPIPSLSFQGGVRPCFCPAPVDPWHTLGSSPTWASSSPPARGSERGLSGQYRT